MWPETTDYQEAWVEPLMTRSQAEDWLDDPTVKFTAPANGDLRAHLCALYDVLTELDELFPNLPLREIWEFPQKEHKDPSLIHAGLKKAGLTKEQIHEVCPAANIRRPTFPAYGRLSALASDPDTDLSALSLYERKLVTQMRKPLSEQLVKYAREVLEDHLSTSAVGRRYNCSPTTVQRACMIYMHQNGRPDA